MRLTSVILVTTAPKQYTMRPAFQPQFRKSKSMTKKLHIKTWGCQMNEYDSSKMADLLDATHGYQLTDVAEEADVLLLNTCSIREKAQEKVFHQLGRWKLLKRKIPISSSVSVAVSHLRKAIIFASAPTTSILFLGRRLCIACRK